MRNTYAKTMAHELGHGLFGLDHTFLKTYGIPKGETNNLMDYTTKTPDDFLSYHEWAQINQPVASWSLFNSDEDNMYVPWSYSTGYIVGKINDASLKSNYYTVAVDSDGSKFALPKDATDMRFSKDGLLKSFVLNGELWCEFHYAEDGNGIKKGQFAGFYKDLVKSHDSKGKVIWKYKENSKPYPNNEANIDKDSVYVPIFRNLDDKSDCYQAFIYKMQYKPSYSRSSFTYYSNALTDEKNEVFINGYPKFIGSDFDTYHCLPESLKKFYLFVTNYYDYYAKNDNNNLNKGLLRGLLDHCSDVRIVGIDNVDDSYKKSDCISFSDFKSDSKMELYNYFVSPLVDSCAKINSDRKYKLLITFDSYSVYQDWHLEDSDCDENAWKKNMSTLNIMVDNVKNKNQKDVYDFCTLISKTCDKWLKTLKYETLQDYIGFIVEETDKTWFKKFNNTAENAVLKLIKSIDVNDYKKFEDYLCKNDPVHGILVFRFMHIFDNETFWYGNDNFTGYVSILSDLYKRYTQLNSTTKLEELDIIDKIINLDDDVLYINPEYTLTRDEKSGNVSLYKNEYDFMSTPYGPTRYRSGQKEIYKDVSPFSPLYIRVDSENIPDYLNKFKSSIIKHNDDNVGSYLVLPLIFLDYRSQILTLETLKNTAVATGVIVGVILSAPLLAQGAASSAVQLVAKKAGEYAAKQFAVGAGVGGASYILGQLIFNDEIKTEDLAHHMIMGGLSNLSIESSKYKWVKPAAEFIINCADGNDASDIIDCIEAISNDEVNCKAFKVVSMCLLNYMISKGIDKIPFLKDKMEYLRNNLKAAFEASVRIAGGNVLDGLKIYKMIAGLDDKWLESCQKIVSDHSSKGFELLQRIHFKYDNLKIENLELLSKFVKDADATTISKLETLLSTKSYQHVVYRMNDALKKGVIDSKKFTKFIDKELKWLKNHEDKIIKIDDNNVSLKYILENIEGKDYLFNIDEFTFMYNVTPNIGNTFKVLFMYEMLHDVPCISGLKFMDMLEKNTYYKE